MKSFKDIPLLGFKEDEVEPVIQQPISFLSFFDLDRVVGFKSCKEEENIVELQRILFENGADISKPYLIRKCQHRPRTSNIIYDGFRVEFSERTDLAWRLSGAATFEALIYTDDESLRKELRSLDPRNAKDRNVEVDEEESEVVE